ncbi:hypothetical protein QBC42DRAFT_326391 [Cladorrhinum samala]|uniref:Copper-fist domain-containing protein n=1 Tax=Cladorrhinum samala TaxID=585594 RepID=A0AAV9HRL5_9PEZI|nr:hypothetical protein QBC42DRAFT_326391 [Cladorrhinum samala]
MPFINGQKMACAPCIRGHRSTKCTHFYERVMIPVRKPGRPLSTCPCPPGRPCQCGGGVRVAIPKKQKCSCPAGAADGSEESENEISPTETATSTSPSRSSFRVSKTGSGSKAGSRKQSFDPANFERIDPRTFNLIASPNGNLPKGINGIPISSPGEGPGLSGLATPGNMMPIGPAPSYMASPSPGSVSMVYNMGPSMTTYMIPQPVKVENGGFIPTPGGNYISPVPVEPYMNGNHSNGLSFNAPPPSAAILGPSPIPKPNGMASRGGGCCSSKAAAPRAPGPAPNPNLQQAIQNAMPPPAPQQNFPVQSDGAVRSCCAGKTQATQPPPPVNMPPPQQGYGQAFDLPQFSSPVDMKMPDLYGAFQPTQTVFRYPADYGSWQHPISPATWHQVISKQNVAPTAEAPISPATNAANNHAGVGGIVTSHECSCGPGCQCLGCLAHPFNAPMFDYVKQAWGSSPNNSANGSASGSTNGSPAVAPIDMSPTHINHHSNNKGIQPTSQRATTNGANGSESPPELPTVSNAGSPATLLNGEEQSLPELEFYFVDLPISGFCEGNIALCPCGDDCECVGCVIHGNSPPLPASSMPRQD